MIRQVYVYLDWYGQLSRTLALDSVSYQITDSLKGTIWVTGNWIPDYFKGVIWFPGYPWVVSYRNLPPSIIFFSRGPFEKILTALLLYRRIQICGVSSVRKWNEKSCTYSPENLSISSFIVSAFSTFSGRLGV